jgi:hypothetical protein
MAIDYVNRYLYATKDIPRSQFQLIGATVCPVFERSRYALSHCITPTCAVHMRMLFRPKTVWWKLQALLIAAKIQELHPPHAIELAELTLGACTARQIAEKELEMVQVCLFTRGLLYDRFSLMWLFLNS